MSEHSPEAMRSAMAGYVYGTMRAYLDAAGQLPPIERARLPLLSGDRLSVIAVGTRYLHLIGTGEALPAPSGQEVAINDSIDGTSWELRFYDPVIEPSLGQVDESQGPRPDLVREVLGVHTHLFHLVIAPGSGLSAHHAQHAGTGLAHSHASADRDFQTMLGLAPAQSALIREMRSAHLAGLPIAHSMLALRIAPGLTMRNSHALDSDYPALDPDTATDSPEDYERVRRAALAVLRGAPE